MLYSTLSYLVTGTENENTESVLALATTKCAKALPLLRTAL